MAGAIFRGPRSYAAEDRESFFGRDRDIDDCWLRIREAAFFVLDGESGCGKSSLLGAGIVPKANDQFRVISARVSEDPFGKLRAAVVGEPYRHRQHPLDAEDEKELRQAISRAAASAPAEAAHDRQPAKPLLVCLDQFEELFLSVSDRRRVRFVAALKDAVSQGKIHLIIAIRSDFLDLLLRLCHAVDPQQQVLNMGNYYTLRAFPQEQAQTVLQRMLAPLHEDDPLRRQQLEDFGDRLIQDLLRPPRDRRLCRDDAQTVLPVELQTVGMMIESLGPKEFSVAGLHKLGGKSGLLSRYLEEAKTYAYRRTAVPPDRALLVLRQLISPAGTKWTRTPAHIAPLVGLPEDRVETVLAAFAERYLVHRLPQPADAARFELMHDHLVHILIEAPDPVLQKAQAAEQRLLFWQDQTEAAFHPAPERAPRSRWRRLAGRLGGYLAQPIPTMEMFRLWRHARTRGTRRMLRRNLRRFCLRWALAIAIVAVPTTAYTLYVRTDGYQIRLILETAPVAQVGSEWQYGRLPESFAEWLIALVHAGKLEEALSAVDKLSHAEATSVASARLSGTLAETGHSEEANTLASSAIAMAEEEVSKYEDEGFLGDLVESFASSGNVDGVHRVLTLFPTPSAQTRAASHAAYSLASEGRFTEAQAVITKGIRDLPARARELARLADDIQHRGGFAGVEQALKEEVVAQLADQAIKTAKGLASTGRDSAIGSLADSFRLSGLTAKALETARLIPAGSPERDRKLAWIAHAFLATADLAAAKSTAEELSNKAERESLLKLHGLWKQVEASPPAKPEEVLRLLDELDSRDRNLSVFIELSTAFAIRANRPCALALAERCTGSHRPRDELMRALALRLARSGNQEALDYAKEIKNAEAQAQTLEQVARNLPTGLARHGNGDAAIEAALKLPAASARPGVLRDVGRLLASEGKVLAALKAAARIPEESERRDELYADIIASLLKSSKLRNSPDVWPRVEQAIGDVRNDHYRRADAFVKLAALHRDSGNAQSAHMLCEKALGGADPVQIPDASKLSRVRAAIAKEFARLGYLRRARLACHECSNSDRLSAHAVILTEFVRARDSRD